MMTMPNKARRIAHPSVGAATGALAVAGGVVGIVMEFLTQYGLD
jgi:hypothetical protein